MSDAANAPAVETSPAEAPPATPPAVTPPATPEAPVAEFKFKAPEGVKFDDAAVAEFTDIAKSLKLPQDGADKVVSLGVKLAAKWQADSEAAVKAEHAKWLSDSKADKEFGGEKLNENLAVANKGFSHLATPELVKFLGERGLLDHPEVIRVFYRAAKEMKLSEDKVVTGGLAPASVPGTLSYSKSNHT